MVTVGMNYYVRAGKEAVFEAACDRVIRTMEGIEGHDESHIYRRLGAGDPAYLIVSRWQSEDAFHGFVRSEAFQKVTDWGRENILAGRPVHRTYRED